MREIFLIDGNSIGFASHSGTKLHAGPLETQAVFGVCRALRGMHMANPQAYKALLWDGRAQWRYELCPDYKGKRETNAKMVAMREAYKAQKPYIQKAAQALGIDQMWSPTCEADDLAGGLAQYFSRKGHPVRLISGDQDWLQLVDENTVWYDPIRDKLVSLRNFEEKTGWKRPHQILDNKCLMGDTSDNIKGVGGIGEVGSKKLLTAFGSVDKLFAMHEAGKLGEVPEPWRKLCENEDGRRDRYYVNYRLMNLLGPAKPGVDQRQVTKGQFQPDGFRHIAEELAFHSILSGFDAWLEPFARTA